MWVKRDDLSAERLGGNKVRTLEFLLARAQRSGVTRLVSTGGTGSNWLLAIAYHGRAVGMSLDALVFRQPQSPRTDEVQRLLIEMGVEVHRASVPLIPFLVLAHVLGGKHLLPPGGSSALGTLGHVVAGLELCQQIREGMMPDPHAVIVALGSGGTAAGLALGLGLGGSHARVVAVRVADWIVTNRLRVMGLARRGARLLDVPPRIAPIEIVGRQFGGRYGRATPAAEQAVRHAAKGGLALETTYTGKALAELLARAPAKPTLFWNTYDGRVLDLAR